MRGYIAVGHGNEPNGIFDPGAVDPISGVREYDLAFRAVEALTQILDQRVDFDTEVAGGPGHDPDYRGSIDKVNKGGYDWAIEIHLDESRAPRGALGLWLSTDDLQWANRILHEYGNRGIPFRGLTKRPDLYFLNDTHCPSLIWEVDRVGSDVTPDQLRVSAECIAAGTLSFLSWKFPNANPTPNPQPTEEEVAYPQIATSSKTARYWVLTGPEGGIDAMGPGGTNDGGVYYGNLIDHPQYNAGEGEANGPAVGIGAYLTYDSTDGYVIYCRDDNGVIHPYHFDEHTTAS